MSSAIGLSGKYVSVRGNRATWHVTGLLSNRTTSYLQVSHRISCSAWEADHSYWRFLVEILLENGEEVDQNVLKQDRWRETAYGINLEEDQAGDWGQNAVVRQHSHQMSAGWRCHRLLRGQLISHVYSGVNHYHPYTSHQDKYEFLFLLSALNL